MLFITPTLGLHCRCYYKHSKILVQTDSDCRSEFGATKTKTPGQCTYYNMHCAKKILYPRAGTRLIIKVSGHQYRWLADGYNSDEIHNITLRPEFDTDECIINFRQTPTGILYVQRIHSQANLFRAKYPYWRHRLRRLHHRVQIGFSANCSLVWFSN